MDGAEEYDSDVARRDRHGCQRRRRETKRSAPRWPRLRKRQRLSKRGGAEPSRGASLVNRASPGGREAQRRDSASLFPFSRQSPRLPVSSDPSVAHVLRVAPM